ncbi:DUF2867 domain-containing protein [Pontibacter cellulosilyticus]|uniref:DUF2867 domain-containing protein n=1 Tax=Pontibacter cellulosilyticus TaxID=1720253 RepID=A0A923NCX8_9BACT|nr:DUF2867 domain-containing protein [Pontibacter cellulosilyticus]MBC5994640.1 DUF2867 domain-containing protein [Pontibacter cellulosilyticus]
MQEADKHERVVEMVMKTEMPESSILKKYGSTFDYVDYYQSSFIDKEQSIDVDKIVKMFFTSPPKWVNVLFTLRNKVVGFLGLKTPDGMAERQQQLDSFKC